MDTGGRSGRRGPGDRDWRGSSLWTLAVDPAAGIPGIGIALTRKLAAHFRRAGRAYMDLSVTHDNAAAIRLYEKLGFRRVPVLVIKRKNAINEPRSEEHTSELQS